jgi:polysaccharide biosynthesis transport protein
VMENRIATFKEANLNSLPDLLQVNLQGQNSAESGVERLNEQLRSLQEKEGYLQLQLSNTSRDIPDMNPDEKRLNDLKLQLTNLNTTFSSEYPDVVKTKAEIAEIEARIAKKRGESPEAGDAPQNPAYVTLASQLASTRTDIESVKRQAIEYTNRVALYQTRVEATPRVEESYKALLIERDNLQAKFNDLMRKMMEARVAQGLEKEQKGERFTLIDPARLPEKPTKPNRLAIALIGIVLGIGAGIGTASLMEFTDDSIRNAETLGRISSFPVLAAIPGIITQEEIDTRKKHRTWGIAAAVLTVIGIIVIFHSRVMDLGLLWVKVIKRIG